MLFDPVGRRELVEEVFVSEGGGDGLLVPDLQRSQGVYGDLPGFYFLLLGQPLLHLLLELVLNLFRLVFILLVVLLEVLLVLFEDLVALLERLGPVLGLVGQVADFLLDDAVGHGDQKHLLLLLEDLDDRLVLAHQVFVLLAHLDYLERALRGGMGTSITFFSFWLKAFIGTYLSSIAVWKLSNLFSFDRHDAVFFSHIFRPFSS